MKYKKLHDLPYMKTGKTCCTLFTKNPSRSASQSSGRPVHLPRSPRSERRTRERAKLASLPVTSPTRDESEPAPGGRAAPELGRGAPQDREPGARAGGELWNGAQAAVPGLRAGRCRYRSRSVAATAAPGAVPDALELRGALTAQARPRRRRAGGGSGARSRGALWAGGARRCPGGDWCGGAEEAERFRARPAPSCVRGGCALRALPRWGRGRYCSCRSGASLCCCRRPAPASSVPPWTATSLSRCPPAARSASTSPCARRPRWSSSTRSGREGAFPRGVSRGEPGSPVPP